MAYVLECGKDDGFPDVRRVIDFGGAVFPADVARGEYLLKAKLRNACFATFFYGKSNTLA